MTPRAAVVLSVGSDGAKVVLEPEISEISVGVSTFERDTEASLAGETLPDEVSSLVVTMGVEVDEGPGTLLGSEATIVVR